MIKRLLLMPMILFLLVGCNLVPLKLNPSKLIGDSDTISHIRLLDGTTGEMVIFAPGEDTRAVLNFIKSLNGTYNPELGASAGYLYWLASYRDGEEVFRLTFGSSIVKVDGKRYALDRDVSSKLDELYQNSPYGKMLANAMNDLASKRDIKVDEIKPISVESHLFSDESPLFQDSSLIFQLDRSPFGHDSIHGYILELSVNGEMVTYHGSGDRVVQAAE